MKKILPIICLSLMTTLPVKSEEGMFPTKEQEGNIVLKTIEYNEQEMTYFIYIPSSKELSKKNKSKRDKTMFFIFHGETSKAEDFLNKTDLHSKIINSGNSFIAFNSTANNWFSQERKNIKDEAFILKMIKYVELNKYKDYKIIAYSSGGSLINKLICDGELQNIENFVLINSSGKDEWLDECKVMQNRNINIINAMEDDYYTYNDVKNKNQKYKVAEEDFLTLSEYQNKQRIKMNCSSVPLTSKIDKSVEDSSYVTLNSYNCNNKNTLNVYNLHYAGHNIPNSVNLGLEDFRGEENKDIDIYDIISK